MEDKNNNDDNKKPIERNKIHFEDRSLSGRPIEKINEISDNKQFSDSPNRVKPVLNKAIAIPIHRTKLPAVPDQVEFNAKEVGIQYEADEVISGNIGKAKQTEDEIKDIYKNEDDFSLLDECESKIFSKSMVNFIDVCDAIETIVSRKLYRKYFKKFDVYCEKRLGLKVCNAYLKIRISKVYKNVCKCTQNLPTNEYQLRELMKIKSEDMQRKAWLIVIERLTDGQNTPKVDDIKKVVISLKNKENNINTKSFWEEKITIDNNFNTILVRWNISFGTFHQKDIKYCATILKRFLTKNFNKCIDINARRTTVLVDAEKEYLTSDTLISELELLLKMCQCIPEYNFLLWTSRIGILRQWKGQKFFMNWPSNVSLALKIRTNDDVGALNFEEARGLPIDTIWLIPGEPIFISKLSDNIRRILVGDRNWLQGKSEDTIIMLRQSLGFILRKNNIIIDIETEAQKIFL